MLSQAAPKNVSDSESFKRQRRGKPRCLKLRQVSTSIHRVALQVRPWIPPRLCAPCFWMPTSCFSQRGAAPAIWCVPFRAEHVVRPSSFHLQFQPTRISRVIVKMIEITQGANAIFQDPANFGSSLGFLIVGAKVRSNSAQVLDLHSNFIARFQVYVNDDFGIVNPAIDR